MRFQFPRVFGCWFGLTGAALVCLITQSNLMAQDETEEPVVESAVEMTVIGSDDGSAPMVFSSINGNIGAFSTASPLAIMGDGDFVMPAPDPFSLISNPSVQKDLELVGDQLDKVRELQKKQSDELREQMGLMRNEGRLDLSNLEKVRESMAKMKKAHQSELKKLLLPHQIERLQQVALQTHMKNSGTANALTSSQVAEELGIDENQIKALKEKSKELNEKLKEKIAKLRDEMKSELLQVLTADQRARLEAMTGDKYQPKDDDWQQSLPPRFRGRTTIERREDN